MASGKVLKSTKYLAKLADTLAPCAFCQRMVDEETTYGKLYRIGDIYCHYFCVLLSCCLIQKGKDEDGLFGFLYHDILAEIERSNKHKCSYCYRVGATIGCSVPKCRKQFHLPCGREKQAISLFYGNYKTFCKQHAPKQKIPDVIMAKAKLRLSMEKKMKRQKTLQNIKKEENCCEIDTQQELQSICMICYEAVDGYPTTQTFWPPCCARDAWFHRSCLERMALSAGIHYLKCPLCNDKDHFYEAVVSQGYYIPDRDAAWELEQNAFADIYERPVVCTVEDCKCPMGREYDADSEAWSIELCVLCGGEGAHRACAAAVRVCADCAPAAPDRHALASLAHVPLPSQNNNTQRQRSGPVMPSRMSLRRTKGRQTSSTSHIAIKKERNEDTNLTEKSRQELNLKSPKKRILEHSTLQNVEKKLLSPLKLLERDLYERILNADGFVLDKNVLDEVQDRFKRPKPLVEKKKIVNEILERFINNISKENIKTKEPIKEWNSPKKIYDKENVMEINTNEIDTKISNTLQEIKEEISTDTKEISENLDSKNMEVFREISMAKDLVAEDDDSNSTFQLPSEFIADYNSDQSLPIFDTPKKLKKVNIEKDSMEISKNDQIINIDLVKIENEGCLKNVLIPEKNEKSALKFSMFNNEVLEKNNMDIDIESFKNQYLNEVDRHFHCNFNHKHVQNEDLTTKLCTAIDFPMDSMKKPPKRKLPSSDGVATKRRKTTKMVENENVKKKRKIKKMKRKSKKNHNNKLSIQNRNINLKIKWKNEELKLKISKPKKKRKSKKNRPKVLRQYVLKFFEKDLQNASICRPDNDVVQLKTKKKRTIKKSDNLKQTSIDSFFKT